MQKQESLGKTLASIDRQTTFLEWDGKQTKIEDFIVDKTSVYSKRIRHKKTE
jgi:hypothetical protein